MNRLLRGHYSPVIALTDSCVSPIRLPSASAEASLEESPQVATSPLLPAGPSRRYLCESFLRCLGPYPGGTWSAFACFFLHVVGLPPYPIEVGYLFRHFPSITISDGSQFRDCSHFFMFRPPSSLASQIVPTAATFRRRAAEAFTSEQNMLCFLRMHRTC